MDRVLHEDDNEPVINGPSTADVTNSNEVDCLTKSAEVKDKRASVVPTAGILGQKSANICTLPNQSNIKKSVASCSEKKMKRSVCVDRFEKNAVNRNLEMKFQLWILHMEEIKVKEQLIEIDCV